MAARRGSAAPKHTYTWNRHGLIAEAELTEASSTAEREPACGSWLASAAAAIIA